MYDTWKVILGIVIFLAAITYPIWYGAVADSSGPPVLEKPAKGESCVEGAEFMRESHMELLDEWRLAVARDGKRVYTNANGEQHIMSLQNTCMDCHQSKERFCDRCHNYVQVAPKCWDCHVAPEFDLAGAMEGK